MATPLAQLVTVVATDGLHLPALFYEPHNQPNHQASPQPHPAPTPTKRLVIWLHGMGSSGIFYPVNHTNALAAAFTATGTAFLGLQNRGGGMLQGIRYFDEAGAKQKRLQGTSHELIIESVHDIDGAVRFAHDHGYTELILAGHSTGANKVALYSYLKPAEHNPFAGYVLYGPGDDTGLFYEALGSDRFHHALSLARQHVKAGRGADLAPIDLLGDHFSYQSIVDLLDPNGHYNTFPFYEAQNHRLGTKPLFREYKTITKPTLVVYGAQDEFCQPDVPTIIVLLQRYCPNPALFAFHTVPDADHGCYQHEPEVARIIADWAAHHINREKDQG